MPKASATTSEITQIASWKRIMLEDIDSLARSGVRVKRYAHSDSAKACATTVCAIPCAPFVLWSAFWRFTCCPVACFSHGPAKMCADNGCTKFSDGAVAGFCKIINKGMDVDALLRTGAFEEPGTLARQCRAPGPVRDAVKEVLQAAHTATKGDSLTLNVDAGVTNAKIKWLVRYRMADALQPVLDAAQLRQERALAIALTAESLNAELGAAIRELLLSGADGCSETLRDLHFPS